MSDTVKTTAKNPFRVNLDAEASTLPGKSLESMLALFAHCQNRGAPPSSQGEENTSSFAAASSPERLSFRVVGRQVIMAALEQVRMLQQRTNEIQAIVLINNWKVADRLWAELLLDCKTPLLELNFLQELWGVIPDRLEAGEWSMLRHGQQFILIHAKVELLLSRQQNLFELSDTLERHLGLWLKQFERILEKLDEKSMA
ncbi:MAG TPA: hypothetical protein VFC44_12435 [Candidatus Saccharimonadales bacterium]|nr:hypothetical protein [Candidatus Saccharimonadales bacterium]